jgi:hypothetical protein
MNFLLIVLFGLDFKLSPEYFKIDQKENQKLIENYNEVIKFTLPVIVNSTIKNNQSWPDIAYDTLRGIIHVVYFSNENNSASIYYTYSKNEGKTWAIAEKVNDTDSAMWPSLTLDGLNRPAVVWVDYKNGKSDIRFSLREENGWRKSVVINDDDRHLTKSPDIFYKNGKYFVAWTDGREDGIFMDIYTSFSYDGIKWSKNIRVNDNLGYQPMASDPSVFIDDKNIIYIVFNGWEGNVPSGRFPDVYFTKSTDGGQTFLKPQIRMNILTDWFQQDPSVVVDEKGIIYAVWEDDAENLFDTNIRFASSIDGGFTWANKIIDDCYYVSSRLYPKITYRKGILYVIWGYDTRNKFQDIYFTMSFDKGNTFLPNQIVNNPFVLPYISLVNGAVEITTNEKGDVYCVWHEYHSDNIVYYDILFSKGKLSPSNKEIKNEIDLKIVPNPVFKSAIISYFLPNQNKILLAIYNQSGQLVKILLNKEEKRGKHIIFFEPDLPNGIYFLKLKTNSFEKKTKFILIKSGS